MIWCSRSITQKAANWLQLLLVVSTLLYVYSPYFDHLFGHGIETRPHTHTYFIAPFSQLSEAHEAHDEHEEQESSYLCSLNIDAALGLLLGFHLASVPAMSIDKPTARLTLPAYIAVDDIFLPTIDPPPNYL